MARPTHAADPQMPLKYPAVSSSATLVPSFVHPCVSKFFVTIKQNCGWFKTLWENPTLSIEIYLHNNEQFQSNIHEDSRFPWIQPGIGVIEGGLPMIDIVRVDYGRKTDEDPRDKVRLEGIPYSNGDIVMGTVDGWHDKYGLFIELQPNMNGLIPMSVMPNLGLDNLKVLYPRGQSVRVRVTRVDHHRNRIGLDFPEGDK